MTQLTTERLGTYGVTSAPTPSRSTQRASPRPIALNAERIVASIRSTVSMPRLVTNGDSPHLSQRSAKRVVCAFAAVPDELAAEDSAAEGDGGPVAAHVDAAVKPTPADLQPRGHLLLGLEAPHHAAADRVGIRLSLQRMPAPLERVQRRLQVAEALVRDLPAHAGGQQEASCHAFSACARRWRSA